MKQSIWLRTAHCEGYIWRYALLVVHARKEEDYEKDPMSKTCFPA